MSAALMVQDVIHGSRRTGCRNAFDKAYGIHADRHACADVSRDNHGNVLFRYRVPLHRVGGYSEQIGAEVFQRKYPGNESIRDGNGFYDLQFDCVAEHHCLPREMLPSPRGIEKPDSLLRSSHKSEPANIRRTHPRVTIGEDA